MDISKHTKKEVIEVKPYWSETIYGFINTEITPCKACYKGYCPPCPKCGSKNVHTEEFEKKICYSGRRRELNVWFYFCADCHHKDGRINFDTNTYFTPPTTYRCNFNGEK